MISNWEMGIPPLMRISKSPCISRTVNSLNTRNLFLNEYQLWPPPAPNTSLLFTCVSISCFVINVRMSRACRVLQPLCFHVLASMCMIRPQVFSADIQDQSSKKSKQRTYFSKEGEKHLFVFRVYLVGLVSYLIHLHSELL